MAAFTVDLPFRLPLGDETLAVNVRGTTVDVAHSVVEQGRLDERLGGVSGSFGLVQDPLGIVRYSRIAFALAAAELQQLEQAFCVDLVRTRALGAHEVKSQIALAVSNTLLGKCRSVLGLPYVRPLGRGDLARLRYEDETGQANVLLYGGGFTLPPAGLAAGAHELLADTLAKAEEPLAFELTALDAIRAAQDGLARESAIMAVGALESALDLYFSRCWRLAQPSVRPAQAITELDPQRTKTANLFTIEDVLKEAGISKKLPAYGRRHPLEDSERTRLDRAIDVRNLVVHGGVAIPADLSLRYAEAVAAFLRDRVKPAVERDCPALPWAEFLYAFEEAMGTAPPSPLQTIAERYLTPMGLDARLYNERDPSEGVSSEHVGRTLVMRVPFKDSSFAPGRVALLVARMVVHFSLAYQGNLAFARVPVELPFEETRVAWSYVAQELTRSVWDPAIDRAIGHFGLSTEIAEDIQAGATELRGFYDSSYAAPESGDVRSVVESMRLARIATALPPEQREDLIATCAKVAPEVASRARWVLPTLDNANIDRPASIRDALVRMGCTMLIRAFSPRPPFTIP